MISKASFQLMCSWIIFCNARLPLNISCLLLSKVLYKSNVDLIQSMMVSLYTVLSYTPKIACLSFLVVTKGCDNHQSKLVKQRNFHSVVAVFSQILQAFDCF